jgi:hypothetical protein
MEDNIISPWITEPEKDCFTPDEEEEKTISNENIIISKEIIKQKINIDEFYSTINKNHFNLKSQNIYIRNYTSYRFNKIITFIAADIITGIYDLFTGNLFRTTIDWVNFIEYIFDKSLS